MKRLYTRIFKTILGLSAIVAFLLPFVGTAQAGVVNLNTATVEEITAIGDIDIPEELAKAIVDYRNKHGKFTEPEDLEDVPGMDDYFDELNPVMKDGDVVYDSDAEAQPAMKAY
jgi:competence protein ComEA